MNRFKLIACSLTLTVVFSAGCGRVLPRRYLQPDISRARIEQIGQVTVIHLYGSPYEMGYQHGLLLQEEVRASVDNVVRFMDQQLRIPMVGPWYVRRRLNRTWNQLKPHVPKRYLEEMRGLADGAKISLAVLQRVHALPELTSASCSSFAAFGPATRDGRLIQIRNLDWAIQSNVQQYSAVFVYHPDDDYHAFVNVGWLGFIGVISGINDEGISVSEIGAETVDESMRGVPMPFLLRRVLEEAGDLEWAVQIIQESPRTVGYNYLFADAKAKRAVALETTRSHCAVFWGDEEWPGPYRALVPDTIFRSDFALDPTVRNLQRASKGDPSRPGLESPVGSSAYNTRYRGQALLLSRFYGEVDVEVAMSIARAIAPPSNMQSIIYAYPELWVAAAEKNQPAAMGIYHPLDLPELFTSVSDEERNNSLF